MARRNENSSSRDAIRARNRVLLRSTKNVQHKKADLSSNTVTVLLLIIPMRFQPEFKTSIDVYSNVICLCPICHRLLHYGADREKIYAAEKIFDFRNERLSKSGIDITKTDFIRLINR